MAMIKTTLIYRWRFKQMGARCVLERPYRLVGPQHMTLGHDVRIRAGARLEVFLPEGVGGSRPGLTIGDAVSVGQDAHIVCTDSVEIGQGSLLGARVTVVDSNHGAATDDRPRDRSPVVTAPVVIGERVWIGNGAVITAGVTIGNEATIGANSVVTHDVAAGDVVGGTPARPLRRSFSGTRAEDR